MGLNYLVLFIHSSCLTLGYEIVGLLENEFPPLGMAATRALLASLLICLLTRQSLGSALRRSRPLALVGVLGIGTLWAMVALGEQSVDPELVMLLVCIVPIATLIITALPPTPTRIWWPAWIGTAIATVGLVIVIGPGRLVDEPSGL